MTLEFKTFLIDPIKANQLLECNSRNRRVSERHVQKLAKDMLSGKWVNNGDTIKFSDDGLLLDGQHRLHAIIHSGVTVPVNVVRGVSDENAFKTIDSNARGRDAAQIAEMMGIKHSTNVAAIARRLLHWENTVDKRQFTFPNSAWLALTTADVVEFAEINQAEIYSMLELMRGTLPYRRCGAGSALVSALIVCKRSNDFAAKQFTEGLKTGANLEENSPISALRDRLVIPPERRGMKWELELMALVIKAFNYHLRGRTIKQLRWRQAGNAPESFPEVGGRIWK